MAQHLARWLTTALLGPAMAVAAAACGDDDDAGDGNGFVDGTATIVNQTRTAQSPSPPADESPSPAGSPSPDGGDEGPVAGAVTLEIATNQDDPLAFSEDELTAPAGAEVTVNYLNDSNLPHNIHFFAGEDAAAPSIAETEIGTGPGNEQTVSFNAPEEAGTYFFQCDVHPLQMMGDFIVEE